jgi:hypothetical protein
MDAGGNPVKKGWDWKILTVVPAILDLVASVMCSLGLLWVNVSTYQMLRGAEMVFSGIFSVLFLNRKLRGYNVFALVLCFLSVVLVGVAGLYGDSSSGSGAWTGWGILLIVLGQAVQAAQAVIEEKLMTDMDAPPLLVVGVEGAWGTVILGVLMVVAQYTPAPPSKLDDLGQLYHENTWDSLVMLSNSASLATVVAIYFLTIVLYNACAIHVTDLLSAVFRTVLDALRTAFIWLAGLFIYYVIKWEGHGESWNAQSPIQLIGFALLLLGTVVYDRMIILPWFYYPPPEEEEAEAEHDVTATPRRVLRGGRDPVFLRASPYASFTPGSLRKRQGSVSGNSAGSYGAVGAGSGALYATWPSSKAAGAGGSASGKSAKVINSALDGGY